ncbi:MAG: hypothetical protein HC844_07795 [Tabrizicola sp.]|nr:hypothetical protein [Tabrizicola sp.]
MPIEPRVWLLAGSLVICPVAVAAEDAPPLSAIDWLSQSVTTPASAVVPGETASGRTEPPVADGGALPEPVATTALDGPSPDAAGLISTAVSGLPRKLWGAGLTHEIAERLTWEKVESLPALRQLFLTILLAEVDAPVDAGGKGDLLRVRIDTLLGLGALEQAAALIEVAGEMTPELFRRSFDVALLTGQEDRACEAMQSAPDLAPTLQARIFCLARSGDWDTAALTLHSADALDQLSDDQATLLARFLDPDLFEGEAPPAPPSPVTPLDWKMFEAIGEPLATDGLPLAFSYADISPQTGWKAQIEAAERLTRAGTIPPNVILGLYTEREAAASGGVWDRVDAFQAFDAAMASRDPARIAATLPEVWARMQEVELEVPFAVLYGKALMTMELPSEAGRIAFRVSLLSPQYEIAAQRHKPVDSTEAFLIAVAKGDLKTATPPDNLGRAILQAFVSPAPSTEAKALIDGNRTGEAILVAIDNIQRGVQGDLRGVTEGLSLLRGVRLESVARRTALELMILERRG